MLNTDETNISPFGDQDFTDSLPIPNGTEAESFPDYDQDTATKATVKKESIPEETPTYTTEITLDGQKQGKMDGIILDEELLRKLFGTGYYEINLRKNGRFYKKHNLTLKERFKTKENEAPKVIVEPSPQVPQKESGFNQDKLLELLLSKVFSTQPSVPSQALPQVQQQNQQQQSPILVNPEFLELQKQVTELKIDKAIADATLKLEAEYKDKHNPKESASLIDKLQEAITLKETLSTIFPQQDKTANSIGNQLLEKLAYALEPLGEVGAAWLADKLVPTGQTQPPQQPTTIIDEETNEEITFQGKQDVSDLNEDLQGLINQMVESIKDNDTDDETYNFYAMNIMSSIGQFQQTMLLSSKPKLVVASLKNKFKDYLKDYEALMAEETTNEWLIGLVEHIHKLYRPKPKQEQTPEAEITE